MRGVPMVAEAGCLMAGLLLATAKKGNCEQLGDGQPAAGNKTMPATWHRWCNSVRCPGQQHKSAASRGLWMGR